MARKSIPVVDGDGHVMENWDDLLQYMPDAFSSVVKEPKKPCII